MALDALLQHNDYKVALDIFEGPLDLLLHLVNKDELDIYTIPIESITQQYLDWLSVMRAMDINVAGEFIVMATTLMSIKSRMLLPVEDRSLDEEDEEALDPRVDLVRQLIEYKQFKDVSNRLSVYEARQLDTFANGQPPTLPDAPAQSSAELYAVGDLGIETLCEAFKRLLARAPSVSFGHLKAQHWRVPDKMQVVIDTMARVEVVPFDGLFADDAPQGEIIVIFIAVLELLRLRHIRVVQDELFGQIMVYAIPLDTPDSHLPIPVFDELEM